MAKKTAARKGAAGARKAKAARKTTGSHIQRMVDKGVLDPIAARNLNPEVVRKVERMNREDIDTIIKFKLKVGGADPWEPGTDGSIF